MRETPVAVYNSTEKKLIGIFKTTSMAAEFIYGETVPYNKVKNLSNLLARKTLIKDSQHEFEIAIRHASADQLKQLGNRDKTLI